jgi:hypothetical protein
MNEFADQLNATRQKYPFEKMRRYWQQEPDGAAECTALEGIFDQLIANLIALGAAAPEAQKLALFQTAIEATNEHDGVIETDEREDLCDLTWRIAEAAGLNPADYGNGEGPASEWRNW